MEKDQAEENHRGESPPGPAPGEGGDHNGSLESSTLTPTPTSACLSNLITSVIEEFDSKAEQTLRSQDQLAFALDRLTGELDQLLDDAPLPFVMQHAARISGVRKRVTSLNSVLKSIQRRIDNIERIMSAGSTSSQQGTSSSLP
ncbi:OLC1v1022315C1 [Oldenlandia corymbosa var. corymbosa]|uniref:Biogenesis of lysosome-related organelles complex 1 subunit 7 n=1 Tax=Oldenlandia corymbosa var. corymbosa TaxID=529605 RepID=A0AAV1BXL1_OLDCO|nr:OLC1v1022315C1 [Oldenlandia corymbosa var. corymbosa]